MVKVSQPEIHINIEVIWISLEHRFRVQSIPVETTAFIFKLGTALTNTRPIFGPDAQRTSFIRFSGHCNLWHGKMAPIRTEPKLMWSRYINTTAANARKSLDSHQTKPCSSLKRIAESRIHSKRTNFNSHQNKISLWLPYRLTQLLSRCAPYKYYPKERVKGHSAESQ